MRPDAESPPDPARPDEDALAERGRLLVAAAVADPATRAPLALRERLEAQRSATAPARRRRRLVLGGGLAGVTAVVLALALLLAPGGTVGGPSIVEAATVAARAPEQGPPPPDPGDARLLDVEAAGIPFPAWQEFDWPPTGVRTDEVDGREVTTVTYRTATGAPVAYSIVDGDALDALEGGRTRDVGGIDVTTKREGDRWIVTWERDGHTCIISAPATVPLEKLASLPAWA